MTAAVLCIDMQMGMAARIAAGRTLAVPEAEAHVAMVLADCRGAGLPVIHVHHHEEGTPFLRDGPGGAAMPCAAHLPGETVLWKSASSAFSGTGLDGYLRGRGIGRIAVVGAVAAFCVTSTVRAASDLGYEVVLPGDALLGFDIPAHDGGRIDGPTVLRVTLSLLGADFARLVPVAGVVAALRGDG